MTSEIYELNCPFCDKLYKLPRDKVIKHVGKFIHCRRCRQPFSIPALPPDEPVEALPEEPIIEVPPPVAQPVEPAVDAPVADELRSPEPSISELSASESPIEVPAVDQSSVYESTGEQSTIGEPLVEPPPTEESQGSIPFAAVDEAFDPPPFPEYEVIPHADTVIEPRDDDSRAHLEESLAAPVSEQPIAEPAHSTDFASETITEEAAAQLHDEPLTPGSGFDEPTVATTLIEPPPSMEAEPITEAEPSEEFTEADKAQEAQPPADEMHVEPAELRALEAPPPLLPPVRVLLPPNPKSRGARATVSPVFDPPVDEPQPRRRMRFGIRIDPPEMIDPVAALPDKIVGAAVEQPVFQDTLLESNTADPTVSAASFDLPIAEALQSSTSTHSATVATRSPAEQVAPAATPQTLEDLSTIRRSVALLATMSVVITLVLIAILLTLLGIIPKK